MRICLVTQEYPPKPGGGGGGIGTQTQLKAQGLSGRGHEVHVVSGSGYRTSRLESDGAIAIHRIAEPKLPVPGFEESTYWLAYSSAVAAKLHALGQEVDFDIVQFPEYGAEGFVYQTDTFRHRSGRYVLQLHGPLAMFAEHMGWPEAGSPLHQIGCFMERTVTHHADLVMASSHNTAAFAARRYGYPLERIAVIHSGVDTELFRPLEQPSDDRHPRLLFEGGVVRTKGIVVLAKTVLNLRRRYPRICLRVVGQVPAELRERLDRIVANAGAEAHFDFRGHVDREELGEHHAWADMFVGPSAYEPGPGNVYLEAMACGRPVIACSTGGAPEVVLDGETGLLVPPCTTGPLAEAITRLADDPELRGRLAAAGRRSVEERFAREKYVDRVESLYEDQLARATGTDGEP